MISKVDFESSSADRGRKLPVQGRSVRSGAQVDLDRAYSSAKRRRLDDFTEGCILSLVSVLENEPVRGKSSSFSLADPQNPSILQKSAQIARNKE
jgi:hypothetical protein